MKLDDDACYRAIAARDSRFDGIVYVGVLTTGIYCRPVCSARTPGRDRCRFFQAPAQAERAGFRPCLRCRPELAPGGSTHHGVSSLAAAAVDRIEAGALNQATLGELAAGLGVTSRHLRRVLEQELGVSPLELAQTRRMLTAKRLLTDTALPMIDIAFASGFRSLRRFNATFQSRYGLTPSEVRSSRRSSVEESAKSAAIRLRLSYRPPLDWGALLAFLRMRATPRVETVVDNTYSRAVRIGAHSGWVRVSECIRENALCVEPSPSLLPALVPLIARLRRFFDLDASPEQIRAALVCDSRLAPLVDRHPGLRIPGAVDGFELGARAILGQQVSVIAATTLAGRLVGKLGDPLASPMDGVSHAFPDAGRIAATSVDVLAKIGMPRERACALRGLAIAVHSGRLHLAPGPDFEHELAILRELRGVGEWTAQYIALRALRWPDAFPATDLGLRRALGGATAAEVGRVGESWRPWRGYAALHLWTSLAA